jgi:hypothetical protein
MMMRNVVNERCEWILTLFAGVTIQVDLWLAAFIRLRMVHDIEVHTFKLLGRLNPFPQ